MVQIVCKRQGNKKLSLQVLIRQRRTKNYNIFVQIYEQNCLQKQKEMPFLFGCVSCVSQADKFITHAALKVQ